MWATHDNQNHHWNCIYTTGQPWIIFSVRSHSSSSVWMYSTCTYDYWVGLVISDFYRDSDSFPNVTYFLCHSPFTILQHYEWWLVTLLCPLCLNTPIQATSAQKIDGLSRPQSLYHYVPLMSGNCPHPTANDQADYKAWSCFRVTYTHIVRRMPPQLVCVHAVLLCLTQ